MSNDNLLNDLLGAKGHQESQATAPPSPSKPAQDNEFYEQQYQIWKQCCDDKEYEKGIPFLLKAAEGDYPHALSDVAFQHFKGELLPRDIEKAESAARRGAVQGDAACQLWLGHILRAKGQLAEALDWFKKAAVQGQGWAAFVLGEMYEKGEGVRADINEAVKWYKTSAKTSNYYGKEAQKALDRLGVNLYESGDYMEQVLSCQIEPGLDLEELYSRGSQWDVFHEPVQLAYLIAAANNGHGRAAEELSGIMVGDLAKSYGIYSPQASDHYLKVACDNYKKMADAGDAEAMADYAMMIKDKNPAIAENYLKRGAELGNVSCQLQLGRILLDRRVYDKAMYWLTKSAEQGQGWAALLVGQMYENGEGTRRDISKAKYWYQVSVDSQNYYGQYAQECLDRLAAQGSGLDLGAVGDAVDEINEKLSDLGDTISSGLKSLFGRFKK